MIDFGLFCDVTVLVSVAWICGAITSAAKTKAEADIKIARINANALLVSEGRIKIPSDANWDPEFLVD